MLWWFVVLGCSPDPPKPGGIRDSGPAARDSAAAATGTPSGTTGAGSTPTDTAPPPLPPNVLLVVLDDVGVDKVGAYGHGVAPPTPTLDALAAEGVRFTRAWSYAVCTPSRAALLTGRYGRRTGTSDHIFTARDDHRLALEEVTLPELLDHAPRPWATAALGKWHLAGVQTDADLRHPLDQGFDHYAGHMENLLVTYGVREPGVGYFHWQKNTDGVHAFTDLYATTDTVEDTLAWTATAPEPWFAMVSFAAPHAPWHVPPPRFGILPEEPGEDDTPWRYDAMLTVLDAELGRLLDGLGDARARTLVVALGDNGTPGEAVRRPFDARRAKATIAEGGVHVPLIVAGPGVTPGVSDALVHLVDVWPTLAETAGLDPGAVPTRGPVDGVSLWPQLRDAGAPGRTTLYTERLSPNGPEPANRDIRVIRDARYKLVERHLFDDPVTVTLHDLDAQIEDGPDLLGDSPSAHALAARDRLLDALAAQMAAFGD